MSKKKIVLFVVLGLCFLCVIIVIIAALSSNKPTAEEPAESPVAAASGETPATKTPKPTNAPKPSNTPKPTATLRPTKEPTPTQTPKPIAQITYGEIRDKRTAMTDAQWDAYTPTLVGLRMEWEGWVEEAKASGELLIDMDPPETMFSIQDCYISVPKDAVLSYNKDQIVRWQGDVKSVTSILGGVSVRFEGVVIVE